MPLSVRKIRNKEYFYYLMSGSKRLYLGTRDKPRRERIEEAIRHVRQQIREQEDELKVLESMIQKGTWEPDFGNSPFYKMVVFDLGGIIYEKPWHDIRSISSEKVAVGTWDILFQELGIYNVHEKLAQDYENGLIENYMKWSEAACTIFKSFGLDKKTFEKVINGRPLTPGAVEVFQILRNHKVKTALVTGSFEALARRASRELGGVDYILAHCKLDFDSRGLLKSWNLVPIDYEDKVKFVKSIADKNGIALKHVAYVGDEANDINVFKTVGLAIAFNCRKVIVQQAADVVIDSIDLRAILPHLYVEREAKKF